MASSAAATEQGQRNNWLQASANSQNEALVFVEKAARARSAGLSVAANELGIKEAAQGARDSRYVKMQRGVPRRFGNIVFDSQLREENGKPVIILEASGGCIHRDFAKQKLLLSKIVSPPLADDPKPAFGYALFTGGSAAIVFFDATGSKCLTGVRIEDPARLTQQLGKREAEL